MIQTTPTTPPSRPVVAAARPRAADPLAARGAVFAAATLIVNAANYGLTLVLGRWLGPEAYGPFASFMALFLLVTLVPSAFQMLVARAEVRANGNLRAMAESATSVGGLLAVTLVGVAWVASESLALPIGWWWSLGATLPAYALLGLARGIAQGRGSLDALGANLLLEALVRVGLVVLVVPLGGGPGGAVAATLLAVPLALGHLRGVIPSLPLRLPTLDRATSSAALPVLGYLVAQAVLVHGDLLVANARLAGSTAGLYAATATLGRVVFFGAVVVTTVVFARVAARRGRDLPWLFGALGVVGAGTLGVATWATLAPETLVTMLFGSAYGEAGALVAPYVLMTGLYAAAHVIGSHHLALGRRGAARPALAAAALHLALLYVVPAEPSALILAQTAVKGVLLLASTAALALARKGED